jgi:hypothetical protein
VDASGRPSMGEDYLRIFLSAAFTRERSRRQDVQYTNGNNET